MGQLDFWCMDTQSRAVHNSHLPRRRSQGVGARPAEGPSRVDVYIAGDRRPQDVELVKSPREPVHPVCCG
ncbi:hypothetical protein BC938DRAFT_471227 [Jimgerdemannia flammicorona]|uniref:Uncharacterized protein n=1 Tax=Jimgerdemannia flammicorona TaxID=994334 RepID=A0A433Q8J9_9FUNG|nr:hypothetical protein BC938DRAFT_471227 [Jimgerdemannia flammicorona]